MLGLSRISQTGMKTNLILKMGHAKDVRDLGVCEKYDLFDHTTTRQTRDMRARGKFGGSVRNIRKCRAHSSLGNIRSLGTHEKLSI